MPNHWESSARPLFIKTVFVNGSRHAILFEKDPLIHCVNSPHKKASRPNSSLSFSSGFSISSSEESQNSECKTFTLGRSQGKDLSSELQSCLIKFKLASNGLKSTKKSGEKYFYNSRAEENSKQKTHKENHNKRCKPFFEESEHKIKDTKTSQEKSCYIYKLENYRRRKNYSFVKITSQSPKFLLNCSCENDWNETHNCNPRNKKNLVISASIQNLVMTPAENENLIEKTFDYILPFENSELHWNLTNDLTKSYYSSLAERVFRWLDLTRKKPPKKPNSIDTCDTNSERICSGEKFANEIKRNIVSCKSQKNSDNKKSGKHVQSDASEGEIEEKVIRESNVETLLSSDDFKNDSRNITEEIQNLENLNSLQNSFSIEESNPSIFNVIKTPIKIQDLFVNSSSKKTTKNHKKRKDRRNVPSDQNTDKETSHSEEERDFSIIKGSDFTEKSESKHLQCYCNRNLDKNGDDISSQILTEEFAERNQKSINTLNNTRTKPVLIQNLSPQQHNKISSLEEEKIIWASEKKTGKPQLHIFMPSVLLKDQSDDSMSECETFFNF